MASQQLSPLENASTMTRQRREACQPRATLGEHIRVHVAPCKGAGFLPCKVHRSIPKPRAPDGFWIHYCGLIVTMEQAEIRPRQAVGAIIVVSGLAVSF